MELTKEEKEALKRAIIKVLDEHRASIAKSVTVDQMKLNIVYAELDNFIDYLEGQDF